ncbi:MAG: ABC transporter ATP-binding protein/permease [Bacilli bacterium]|nr:ABC transporter ATP-binding protein/permease [Bacilli bacterium]
MKNMLELEKITKNYILDKNLFVPALKGIDLKFPQHGFAAVLGQSGCGKTTLLNIIGGLDRYTSGDLRIDGKSTRQFGDKDWDNYRNKKIGMVFQSYNLIGHMSVVGNVEIAMTLSGVSRSKRHERALKALDSVGLISEINKKPNQLSGGQMQRVAIARAIVNNPNIILADEPTGALDSQTSIQIMDILEELSKEKLIIMVTHNRNLAFSYATRVIEMSDGLIIKDTPNIPKRIVAEKKEREEKQSLQSTNVIKAGSNSFTMIESDFNAKLASELSKEKNKQKNKTSMAFSTALSISGKNLKTKKGRTIMTAIAGSIGIIGVALVLAISNGFSSYISNLESETLSSFPVSVEEYTYDFASLSEANTEEKEAFPEDHDIVVSEPISSSFHANNITDDYLDYVADMDPALTSAVQYRYSLSSNVLSKNETTGKINTIRTSQSSLIESYTSNSYWNQLPDSKDFILSQYDLIEGTYPSSENEVVLVVDEYNSMYSSTLEQLGFDADEKTIPVSDILSHTFKMIPNDDYYTENAETKTVTGYFLKSVEQLKAEGLSISDITSYLTALATEAAKDNPNTDTISAIANKMMEYFEYDSTGRTIHSYSTPSTSQKEDLFSNSGTTLKVSGILRPKESTVTSVLNSGIYYTKDLVNTQLNVDSSSKIAKDYANHLVINKLLDIPVPAVYNVINNCDQIQTATTSEVVEAISNYFSYRKVYGTDIFVTSITIYPKSFDDKKDILKYLDNYNINKVDADKVTYTDLAGSITSSLETLVNIISSVLIAFASISLVVSSVMIGIITHTSVIERTKEIGILRAVGARKKDVSRLFEAEATIIGMLAGVVGVGFTYLVSPLINIIINNLNPNFDTGNIAYLLPGHALMLIAISIALTFVASLVPARIAAHKDPVVALRTE